MESDAQSGFRNHRQVVRTVAHGNGLCQIHLLHLRNQFQQFGFPVSVHYLAHVATCQFAVLANLQFVGIDVVDTVLTLQVFTEIGESTRQDGNLIATSLQNTHQSVHTLRDGQVFGYVLHHTDIQSLQ